MAIHCKAIVVNLFHLETENVNESSAVCQVRGIRSNEIDLKEGAKLRSK